MMKLHDSYLMLDGPIRLARAHTECWRCRQATEVVALAAANVREVDGGVEVDASDAAAFVYHIDEDDMPGALTAALSKSSPRYLATYSAMLGATTWANRCSSCGALQGAHYLHEEPDGVFFGSGPHRPDTWEVLLRDPVHVADASYAVIGEDFEEC